MKPEQLIQNLKALLELGSIGAIDDNENAELEILNTQYGEAFNSKIEKSYYEFRLKLVEEFETEFFRENYYQFYTPQNQILIDKYKRHLENILKDVDSETINSELTKLNWLAPPSQFAYIFKELADKGFIEIPSYNSEASYQALGKALLQVFNLNKSKSTKNSLSLFSRDKEDILSDSKKSKIILPESKDLK